jgi:predicted anti-sigma-YlaC factor YlaD
VTAKASAFLDSELGLRERLAIRLHLLMCVHCRRFRRQLQALVEAMSLRGQAEAEALPPELLDRIMTGLARAHTR